MTGAASASTTTCTHHTHRETLAPQAGVCWVPVDMLHSCCAEWRAETHPEHHCSRHCGWYLQENPHGAMKSRPCV